MKEVAIVSSVRTAIAKAARGSLKDTRPDTFASATIKEAVSRAFIQPNEVEDIVLGCAMPEAEQGMNIARIAGLLAGIPDTASAATVNRFCSSGLQAVADIANAISVGQIQIGVAGGVESMSMVPMGGNRPSANPELMAHLPQAYVPMGLTAENVSKKFGITREMQDQYALESHQRAIQAMENGLFKDEIVPLGVFIYDPSGKKQKTFQQDEGPRLDTSLDILKTLKPAFDTQGVVTAGNSSQVSDGASACVLMDASFAKEKGIKPMGYFRGFATAGVPPDIMGIGPVPAIQKLLSRFRLRKEDISVYEINEAFAAQVVYCIRELELPREKVNPCGGAIALGHPLGCTGARQVATILRELKRQNGRFGVVSMCVGGGMGAAGLIERAE